MLGGRRGFKKLEAANLGPPDRSAPSKYAQGLALSIGHISQLWQQKIFSESVDNRAAGNSGRLAYADGDYVDAMDGLDKAKGGRWASIIPDTIGETFYSGACRAN